MSFIWCCKIEWIIEEEDRKAKLQLCSKYLEMCMQIKEWEKIFVDLSINILAGMRDMLLVS